MCRKSGLQYTRDFVSAAGGDEAVGYLRQFGLLNEGDGLKLGMFKGLYRELINMAAQHSWAKRGYLIDADDKPLSDAQIGKLLRIKGPTMGKILRQFASVKLLDKVDMPEFDMSLNDLPPRKKDESRGTPGKSGKNQAPLKKRQNGKTAKPPKGGKKINEQKATNGLTAVNAKENKNDKAHRHNANVQGKVRSRGQAKEEPPSTPTTTPPFKPQVSDAPGGSKVIPFTAPRTSFNSPGGPQRPRAVCGYDRSDEIFGKRIYVELGLRWDTASPEGRREICCFASKWAQARASLARLPPEVRDEIGVRLISEARKIAKRGKRNKRPGAVWCIVADKLVTARLREAM